MSSKEKQLHQSIFWFDCSYLSRFVFQAGSFQLSWRTCHSSSDSVSSASSFSLSDVETWGQTLKDFDDCYLHCEEVMFSPVTDFVVVGGRSGSFIVNYCLFSSLDSGVCWCWPWPRSLLPERPYSLLDSDCLFEVGVMLQNEFGTYQMTPWWYCVMEFLLTMDHITTWLRNDSLV